MGRSRDQVANVLIFFSSEQSRACLLLAPSRTLRRNFTNLDKCFIFLLGLSLRQKFSAFDAITISITAKLKQPAGNCTAML